MEGGPCRHPASSLYFIREQGITICTLCNDVVPHQMYELDPQFSHRGGAGSGGGAGSMYRPLRATVSGPNPHARPSIEVARRHMLNIARAVEMTEEHVEMALGIYKLAVNMNVISGTRDTVLCACLYAVCRREHLPHVIYDFSNECQVRPQAILSQMRYICQETHTEVPVVDPACLVQRFADYLDLGPATPHVLICALKLLRAMREDWIACGRRPMGVCAAALVAACCLLGVPRTADQICGVVRLTAGTIMRRLNEFSCTPAAQLTSIDAYAPTNTTLPPAFTEASQRPIEEDANAGDRMMRSLYFQLVGEAKVSAPPTPERCQRWRFFVKEHCRLQNILVTEEDLDLNQLSPEKQLIILGLPHTKPIPPAVVEESVRKEESRLLLLKHEESSGDATGGGEMGQHSASFSPLGSSGMRQGGFPFTDPTGCEEASDTKKWWWMDDEGVTERKHENGVASIENGSGGGRENAANRGFASAAEEEEWVGRVWHKMSSSRPIDGENTSTDGPHRSTSHWSPNLTSGGEAAHTMMNNDGSFSPHAFLSTTTTTPHTSGGFPFLDCNEPGQISELVAQFEKAKELDEVRHLEDEFDFSGGTFFSSLGSPSSSTVAGGPFATATSSPPSAAPGISSNYSMSHNNSTMFLSGGGVVSSCGGTGNVEDAKNFCSSSSLSTMGCSNAGMTSSMIFLPIKNGMTGTVAGDTTVDHRRALAELLWDKERRHALPWEFIILPEAEEEDTTDIISYIILDNEERLRRYKIGEVMYKEKWERGRAKSEVGRELYGFSSSSLRKLGKARHKKHLIHRATGVKAVDRALRGCGAGNIRTSHLAEIIPEITGEEEEIIASPEEWWE